MGRASGNMMDLPRLDKSVIQAILNTALLLVAVGVIGAGAKGADWEDNPPVQPVIPNWAPVDKESQIRLKPGEYTIDNLRSEILSQTGNYVEFFKERAPKGVRQTLVKIDKEQVGFWELLDLICDAGGLTYASQPGDLDDGLKLIPGKRPKYPEAKSGPALLRIRAVEAHRSLQGASEGAAEVRLDAELVIEPRLAAKNGRSNFTFADTDKKGALKGVLRTDTNQELACLGLQLMRSVDFDREWSEWGSRQLLRFAAPPAGTQSLSAELPLSLKVCSEPRLIRLNLAAGEMAGRADGVEFSISDFFCGPASARAEAISIRKKGLGAPIWGWPWAHFRDKDGRLLRTERGGGSYGGDTGETSCALRGTWQPPQGPAAFVEAAYYLKEQKIDLAFKVGNLPWSLEPGKPQPSQATQPKVEWEILPRIPPVEGKPAPKVVKPPAVPKRPPETEEF